MFQAQIDNYLGREPVSVESVVVESIKSDVLQVSTPPPRSSHLTFISSLKTAWSDVLLTILTERSFPLCNFLAQKNYCCHCGLWTLQMQRVAEAETVGTAEGGGSTPRGQPQWGRQEAGHGEEGHDQLSQGGQTFTNFIPIRHKTNANFTLLSRMTRDLDLTLTMCVWKERPKEPNSFMRMRWLVSQVENPD